MSSHDSIIKEINEYLDYLATRNEPWVAKWIANSVCQKHMAALSKQHDSADFWMHCGYDTCRKLTTKCINKRAGVGEEIRGQMTLPGHNHLQAYYIVPRDGVEVGVPLSQLSDDEIELKALSYESMATGCIEHADELRRYAKGRSLATA